MRRLFLLVLLAGCSQQSPEQSPDAKLLYAGQGRDRLCISGDRGGFVIYGEGDSNCSAKGRIERGPAMAFLPNGDTDCRIPLEQAGDTIRMGEMSEACAYYCAPGAGFAGKSLSRAADATPAVDFAGDPLC